MHKHIAKDGDRLDSIVYAHYGSLEPLEKVAAANPLLEPILRAGDAVLLPVIEIKAKEMKLW